MKKTTLIFCLFILANVLLSQNANKVTDIRGYYLGTTTYDMADVNGTLYLGIYDTINGRELWKSDGTSTGTQLVKNITTDYYVIGYGTLGVGPKSTIGFNGKTYFSQPATYNGNDELYVSDGTNSGTQKVITSGTPPTQLSNFITAGNYLYFNAGGSDLWRTDGTDAGSTSLSSTGSFSYPSTFTAHQGNLFFKAYEASSGSELWKTDGTSAGTVLVKDIEPGPGGSYIGKLISSGSKLFFNNYSSQYGYELWTSDGTAPGTDILLDLNPGTSGSNLVNMTDVNGTLFFGATDSLGVNALWKTDGTVVGTVKVKDSLDLSQSNYSKQTVNANGKLFFAAYGAGVTGSNGLWVSDGTTNGTILLLPNSQPANMVSLNGIMYAIEIGNTTGILRSDGTIAGTYYIDNTKGFTGTIPTDLTVVGNKIFFASSLGNHYALWTIDGITGIATPLNTSNTSITVYPNPTKDCVTIRTSKEAEAKLLSVSGELIDNFHLSAGIEYRIDNLAKGIYILETITKDNRAFNKIIVQ